MHCLHFLKLLRAAAPIFFVPFLLFLSACSSDENPIVDPPANSFLTGSSLIAELSGSEVKAALGNFQGLPVGTLLAALTFGDVKVYRITYLTPDVDGTMIEASGALALPAAGGLDLRLISYQHGTIVEEEAAPSNFAPGNQGEFAFYGLFTAGLGYAAVASDYIGFGASAGKLHPYEHGATLGRAAADMLLAVREFVEAEEELGLSDKLFLTGYSEGGYATMAMHRYLEEQTDISVTVSAPGAGAYNKSGFARHILSQDTDLEFIATYLWVVHSYNRIYGLDRPLSDYIREPYAAMLAPLSPRVYAGVDFPRNPQQLFRAGFLADFMDGTDREFVEAVADNDLFDWLPLAPVRLYHGVDDSFVPFFNSQDAFDAMSARGADVMLIGYEGKDHDTAVINYVLDVFALFESMK